MLYKLLSFIMIIGCVTLVHSSSIKDEHVKKTEPQPERFIKEKKFNGPLIYSARKGTPAQKFYPDDVSLAEKKRRHKVLTAAWKESKPNA